ncbi:hypothetical protein KM043_009160 [Ampulex compressa]|nr:hypothetical protein KM043_009160 [Ampulex compressa]
MWRVNRTMNERRSLLAGSKEPRIKERKIDLPVVDTREARMELVNRIEKVSLQIIQQICSRQLPILSYTIPCNYDLSNCEEDDEPDEDFDEMPSCAKRFKYNDEERGKFSGIDKQIEEGLQNKRKTVVNFASSKSKKKFALMMTVMARAHRLLLMNTTITRRSFYYDLKNGETSRLALDQRAVDEAVNSVANLLECPPWNLRLIATSKGLVAGDATLSLVGDKVVDCKALGGALIPQMVPNVTSVRAKVNFALVVEKDAIFQKLLEEDCTRRLNCLLITGKGYPDVATRMLVKFLAEEMELPVYVLVDADPFGVDIMLTYRFGSIALSRENASLASPKVRWLGIFPSELEVLGVKMMPLNEADLSKLASIKNRPYVTEQILEQLNILRNGKAEIEAIASFSSSFLTSTYLSCKTKGNKFI